MESLLIANQIRSYCDQVDSFAGAGFGKLFLAGGLHKESK
jgi:translation initiation factor 3 subunit H